MPDKKSVTGTSGSVLHHGALTTRNMYKGVGADTMISMAELVYLSGVPTHLIFASGPLTLTILCPLNTSMKVTPSTANTLTA